MFKTTYNAMMQNIAPAESTCQQVLATMQAEEARQMTTILPVKQVETRRPIWTLVACIAMVTVAVALTWALTKEEKPPVLPAGTPTTVMTTAPTTTTTEALVVPSSVSDTTSTESTTTATEELVVPPSTNHTTSTENATTPTEGLVAPPSVSNTTSTESKITTTTTIVATTTTPTTTSTVISTLPTAGGYEDLFQWIEKFTSTTTATTTKKTTTSTTSDSVEDGTTVVKPQYSTAPQFSTAGSTTSTTVYKDITDDSDWLHSPKPYGGGVVQEYTSTSDTAQLGDKVIGRLQNNTVSLTWLDSYDLSTLSTIAPPLSSGFVVKEFALYGDRLVIICGPEFIESKGRIDTTDIFVYDISNPSTPRLLQKFGQDGYYMTAHRIEDTLYVLSYHSLRKTIDNQDPASFVPRLYRQGNPVVLLPSQITPADHPTCCGYTVLTAISLKGQPTLTDAAALFGQNNSYVYLFQNSIMIASKPRAVSPPTTKESGEVTDVVQVILDNGAIHFSFRVTLKGEAPLIHFTGEHYYLLLSNTRPEGNHPWETTNRHFYALNRQLKTVGKLENFWERLSGRLSFTDDTLYAIDNSRRRYTLDLRDLTNPTLLPRVENLALGTRFFHSLENGRLLTLEVGGSIIASIVDDQWNYLYRTEDSSNFIGEPKEGLLVFLKRVYTYDADTGFTVEAETDFHPHTRDCLATDRTLYLIELDRILAYDRTDNYRLIGQL